VFESVTHAYDVAGLTNQFKLDSPIQTGRWYNITIDVGTDTVKCYLDGKLLMTYTPPSAFFAIAGKDATTGDLIIKTVNAGAEPYTTQITLDNLHGVKPQATLITLQAPNGEAENSFEKPKQYVPDTTIITGVKTVTFKPYSINVLRIHPH
jgi:alpha-L-arabinofuranosidase